jgi:hypothetical protein
MAASGTESSFNLRQTNGVQHKDQYSAGRQSAVTQQWRHGRNCHLRETKAPFCFVVLDTPQSFAKLLQTLCPQFWVHLVVTCWKLVLCSGKCRTGTLHLRSDTKGIERMTVILRSLSGTNIERRTELFHTSSTRSNFKAMLELPPDLSRICEESAG